jgi:hypothetical protein
MMPSLADPKTGPPGSRGLWATLVGAWQPNALVGG